MLPCDLDDTLVRLADVLRAARDDWWIIGSAAVALHGVIDIDIADVDVLISVGDARRIVPKLGLNVAAGSESTLFRSAVFATWDANRLPVEFMAGFEWRDTAGWHQVSPTTRERRMIGDAKMFVPSRAELLALLAAFGRPKDERRARLLAALD